MLPLILLGAGALLAIVLLLVAFSGPSADKASARRLQALRERHSESSEVRAQAKFRNILSNPAGGKVDTAIQKLIPNPAMLDQRLGRTGRDWTLSQYVMVSAGLALFVLLLFLLQGASFFLALFAGLFAGIGLPHYVVGSLISRRAKRFNQNFPDAIELMVRGLRSGLPISETMGVVAGELDGPVGTEFRAVSDKMRIGRTMDAALQDTADRLGTPEFQFFVIALSIQRETGGNLAETLANLADVLRKRAAMRLKIKAMSSEAKASALILGALPFLVFALIYFMNPTYAGGFFVEPRLMIAGTGALVWIGIGAFIMSRMVSFEI